MDKQPPWRNALRRVAPAQNLKRENPGSSPKANWRKNSPFRKNCVWSTQSGTERDATHKPQRVKETHKITTSSLSHEGPASTRRTDGRKLGTVREEELTAMKQPRSLKVSTTTKNRDVCQWATGLSSLEIKYGVSPLLHTHIILFCL